MDLSAMFSDINPVSFGMDVLGDQISARTNYRYQRNLRKTAYQDTVKDLRAAGLNPILAIGNGANSAPPFSASQLSGAFSQNKAREAEVEQKRSAAALMDSQEALNLSTDSRMIAEADLLRQKLATEKVSTAQAQASLKLFMEEMKAKLSKADIKSKNEVLQWIEAVMDSLKGGVGISVPLRRK